MKMEKQMKWNEKKENGGKQDIEGQIQILGINIPWEKWRMREKIGSNNGYAFNWVKAADEKRIYKTWNFQTWFG